MDDKTGGPAFPCEQMQDGDYMLPANQVGATVKKIAGMTLRDYFAAKAMQALLSRNNRDLREATGVGEIPALWASREAYQMADAMLEARKNG